MMSRLLASAAILAALTATAAAGQPCLPTACGTVTFTNPEAYELRKQYQEWARDNRILMTTWIETVGEDLEQAANVILYDKTCEPVQPERLHHAKVLLEAFPDWGFSRPEWTAAKRLEVRGRDAWCRWAKGTPKPLAP
jgi:hypothetical protein